MESRLLGVAVEAWGWNWGWGGVADVSSNASELPPPMAGQPGQDMESFHAMENGRRLEHLLKIRNIR